MRIKITNRKRFIKSTGILLSTIIFLVLISIGTVVFSNKEVKYKTTYVSKGDTLWKIARNEQNENEYYKNKDIRYIIKDIKSVNCLDNNDLYISQQIIIPTI